jgi:hypothetical protein
MSRSAARALSFLPHQVGDHLDVLTGGERRRDVEELEYEADFVALIHGQVEIPDPNAPAGGLVQPADHVHKGGFAGAARSQQYHEPAVEYVQIDVSKRGIRRLADVIIHRNAPEPNERVRQARQFFGSIDSCKCGTSHR